MIAEQTFRPRVPWQMWVVGTCGALVGVCWGAAALLTLFAWLLGAPRIHLPAVLTVLAGTGLFWLLEVWVLRLLVRGMRDIRTGSGVPDDEAIDLTDVRGGMQDVPLTDITELRLLFRGGVYPPGRLELVTARGPIGLSPFLRESGKLANELASRLGLRLVRKTLFVRQFSR